jgi:predicted transcriptional regulator
MSNVITTRVSDDTLAMIDRLAESKERSRAWIVAKLVEAAAHKEIELLDFIQQGIESIERGEYYTQEEAEAWFEARVANRPARIAAE